MIVWIIVIVGILLFIWAILAQKFEPTLKEVEDKFKKEEDVSPPTLPRDDN